MKKDFKPGDPVTVVTQGEVYCKGKIDKAYQDSSCVVIDAFKSCTVHKSTIYHGHNVKVEITGEELPERLRMEWVKIPLQEDCIQFSDQIGKVKQKCFVQMPSHIARQYCDWLYGE